MRNFIDRMNTEYLIGKNKTIAPRNMVLILVRHIEAGKFIVKMSVRLGRFKLHVE